MEEQSSDSLGPAHNSIFRSVSRDYRSLVGSRTRPRMSRRRTTDLSAQFSVRRSSQEFDLQSRIREVYDFGSSSKDLAQPSTRHPAKLSSCRDDFGPQADIYLNSSAQKLVAMHQPKDRIMTPQSRASELSRCRTLASNTAMEEFSQDAVTSGSVNRELKLKSAAEIESCQIFVTCIDGLPMSQNHMFSAFSAFGQIKYYKHSYDESDLHIIQYYTSDGARVAIRLDGRCVYGRYLHVRQHLDEHLGYADGNTKNNGHVNPDALTDVGVSRHPKSGEIFISSSPTYQNRQSTKLLGKNHITRLPTKGPGRSVGSTPPSHVTEELTSREVQGALNTDCSLPSLPVSPLEGYFNASSKGRHRTSTPVVNFSRGIDYSTNDSSPVPTTGRRSRMTVPIFAKEYQGASVHERGCNLMGLSNTFEMESPIFSSDLPLSLSFDVAERIHGSSCKQQSPNEVLFGAIARKSDLRTTIMIKNIPNKISQEILKKWIDETNEGTYNFLYLPMDLKNECNVGYAFINFVDPIGIITFGQARVGTIWSVFGSEKVCDVSYANIQGKFALAEKFRNSCVMDERESYHPHIYHTYGPQTGSYEPFPQPNNSSRKARSSQAAKELGLLPFSKSGPDTNE